MVFRDRAAAGDALAERLRAMGVLSPLVIGVARGGIVVAAAVADGLSAQLDVVAPRKLPHPANEEVAIGAVAEDGSIFVDNEAVAGGGISPDYIELQRQAAAAESKRRVAIYRGNARPIPAKDRMVILVDDGIATGFTLLAAATALRAQLPRRLIIAVPVAPYPVPIALQHVADQIVVLAHPEPFYAVGQAYERFDQVDDSTVVRLIQAHRAAGRPRA